MGGGRGGALLLSSQNAVEAEMLRSGLERWRDGPGNELSAPLLSSKEPGGPGILELCPADELLKMAQ